MSNLSLSPWRSTSIEVRSLGLLGACNLHSCNLRGIDRKDTVANLVRNLREAVSVGKMCGFSRMIRMIRQTLDHFHHFTSPEFPSLR